MGVIINGNVAFLDGPGVAVWFSKPSYTAYGNAGNSGEGGIAASPVMEEIMTDLKIAPWGEDNLFPQKISAQLEYCGVALSALDFKARTLWGQGIRWGKIVDYKDDATPVYKIAKPGEHKDIEDFMRYNRKMHRFYLEFNQDWTTFSNCFPEAILSRDGKKIMRWVHQESCDCRLSQMNRYGRIEFCYLSKIWGAPEDQIVKFDPKKSVEGMKGSMMPKNVDNRFIIKRRAIDMYDPVNSLKDAVSKGARSVIYPVNYPSTNKTYYQKCYWDGARMSGWMEIASKIPTMFKAMYEQAFNIQYHIEIPEDYFERKYGSAAWKKFTEPEQEGKRKEELLNLDKWLKGSENSYKTMITFFQIDKVSGAEVGRVKINPIERKSNIDKDLMTSGAANSEILFAMQINPNILGAGMPGGIYSSNQGGSNIREGYLIYTAGLHLERQTILEPLYLTRDYNGWDPELEFFFQDVVLTTLDKGKGTEKKLS